MSDKPQGPGWWQAGDGAWYPPEQHLSAQAAPVTEVTPALDGFPTMAATPAIDGAGPKIPPIPVPELPKRPTWSGESDRRPEAGPMYPDLFNQALAGSSLANVVTVKYADGEPRPGLDMPVATGRSVDHHDGDQDLVSTSARGPAQVGAFTGASAKKRRRILR
ncbi:MAG TPA: hypothetical protein VII96_00700 [Acidimicrobiales bacterium]